MMKIYAVRIAYFGMAWLFLAMILGQVFLAGLALFAGVRGHGRRAAVVRDFVSP